MADLSCSDGDVPTWNAVMNQWICALDSDTLVDLDER